MGMDWNLTMSSAGHLIMYWRGSDVITSFQILRGQIPELKEPKVIILSKASKYIKQIREEDEDLQSRMAREKRRESKLLQRLDYLKSLLLHTLGRNS